MDRRKARIDESNPRAKGRTMNSNHTYPKLTDLDWTEKRHVKPDMTLLSELASLNYAESLPGYTIRT